MRFASNSMLAGVLDDDVLFGTTCYDYIRDLAHSERTLDDLGHVAP